jgi:hypothetical protein
MTGTGTALELAACGWNVTLIDQDEIPMNRASMRNEGKIHLGFVYANDRTLATSKLQLEGALSFRAILSRWIGAGVSFLRPSAPFIYLVARDSVLSPDELSERYTAVESLYRESLGGNSCADYLGRRPERLFEPCPLKELTTVINTDGLRGAFRTAEVALDTDQLARLVRGAVLKNGRIRFLNSHKVTSVERVHGRFRIEGTVAEKPWQIDAEQVVNALWENRLLVDRSVGLPPPPGWVHRLKFRVIARLPERLRDGPSVTMVLGPYGDVVIRPDCTAYFSWYPLCLRGWTHDIAPPESWNRPCRGELSSAEAASVARDLLGAIGTWYRGAEESTPLSVDAGAIIAYGLTDVGDAASGLHCRTCIGVTSIDGYHSVDPGKLTTAPLFARLAAQRVVNGGGGA